MKRVFIFSLFILSVLLWLPAENLKVFNDSVYDDPVTQEFSLQKSKDLKFCLYHKVQNSVVSGCQEIFRQKTGVWCKKDIPGISVFWIKDRGLVRAVSDSKDWQTKSGIKVGDSLEKAFSTYETISRKAGSDFSVKLIPEGVVVNAGNQEAEEIMSLLFHGRDGIISKIEIRSGEMNWNQYENPDYNYGNGTILLDETLNKKHYVKRKCELEAVVGDMLSENKRDIYSDYNGGKKIGSVKDNDKLQIFSVLVIEDFSAPFNRWGEPRGEVWYEVQLDEIRGWICRQNDDTSTDPYKDNRFEILERIQGSGKTWTVRSLNEPISVWERVNVRDNPGLNGKKIFLLNESLKSGVSQLTLTKTAITEETETIDGITDHWIKVEYEPGKFGWIFAGYASSERGGPKHSIPEEKIKFYFGWR